MRVVIFFEVKFTLDSCNLARVEFLVILKVDHFLICTYLQ